MVWQSAHLMSCAWCAPENQFRTWSDFAWQLRHTPFACSAERSRKLMIFSFEYAPAATCRLPAPWHCSQAISCIECAPAVALGEVSVTLCALFRPCHLRAGDFHELAEVLRDLVRRGRLGFVFSGKRWSEQEGNGEEK